MWSGVETSHPGFIVSDTRAGTDGGSAAVAGRTQLASAVRRSLTELTDGSPTVSHGGTATAVSAAQRGPAAMKGVRNPPRDRRGAPADAGEPQAAGCRWMTLASPLMTIDDESWKDEHDRT